MGSLRLGLRVRVEVCDNSRVRGFASTLLAAGCGRDARVLQKRDRNPKAGERHQHCVPLALEQAVEHFFRFSKDKQRRMVHGEM